MNRAERSSGLLVLLVLLLSGCASEETAATKTERSRVLLLTVDTLRSDYLSLYDYDRPTTPAIDALLSDGVHFPNALAPVPRTTPSLASLLTGAYPHTTGVRTLYDRLAADVPSLAEDLRRAGYRTIAVVSNHVLTRDRGLDRGFDVWDGADDARDAEATTAAALTHLDGAARNEKIFLWVHYIDPHVPYFPPQDIAREFDPDYDGRYRDHFGEVRGGVGDAAYPPDLPKAVAVYQNPLPDEVNAHVRRLYAADIRATDEAIARLLEGLRTRPADDWLTVFTADHGESLGEHPHFFYDHGDYVDLGSLRVPLGFVLPPGDPLARSRRVDDWVSLVDVAPTLRELLDLPRFDLEEGRSLRPYLLGEDPPPHPVFAESGRSFYPRLVRKRVDFGIRGRFRAVVEGDAKLVWTPGLANDEAWELYDLSVDPLAVNNVYSADDPRVRNLQSRLRKWLRETNEESSEMSPEDVERLRSLGYLP